jgi:hypothetical protein
LTKPEFFIYLLILDLDIRFEGKNKVYAFLNKKLINFKIYSIATNQIMSRFESNLGEIKINLNKSINDKMNETSIYTNDL